MNSSQLPVSTTFECPSCGSESAGPVLHQLRGSRVRYAKPLSLFISINVVYYLSIALFDANTFTTPLSVQLYQNDYYSGFVSRQVERRLQADSTSIATFEANYDQRTSVLSKTLIFLFIPMYAAIFYALFFMQLSIELTLYHRFLFTE